jgi:hypothetical protein
MLSRIRSLTSLSRIAAIRYQEPPEGTSFLATYGASRASAHAAAELLGLASA